VLGVSAEGVTVAASDGAVLLKRARPAGGGKVAAAEWVSAAGVKAGDKLGG
jgi:methionyl-tRNA formyltransferase